MPKKLFHVYIMSSRSRTLYVGWTGDIVTRAWEHKQGTRDSFTARYRINRLVYLEEHALASDAFEREREIKTWLRSRKVALIESVNPAWDDLSEDWYDGDGRLSASSEEQILSG